MAQFAVQVGAAAIAVGLSLAGPQAVGLAAADTGDSPSDSSVGSESANQSRAGKPAGTRRSAAPRSAAAARTVSPNKPVVAPPAIPHVLPTAAETAALDVPVPSASWLRVGGSDPAAAAPVPAATVAVSLPTPPVAVKAPQAASASAGAPVGVSSALARFMSTVLPAGGIAEGALLLLRRGVGTSTVRTATVPRPAATVDANGNQVVTLNDPTQVTQGSISIQGGSAYGPGVLDSLIDLANGGYTHDYIAVSFTAAETKTYVFGQTDAPLDNAIVVYDGTFNPASPSTNAIAVNNNRTSALPNGIASSSNGCGGASNCPQVSVNLTAGQTVTLMITTASDVTMQQPIALPQTIYTNGAGNFFKPGSANQVVTFTSPSEVGQGVMSIRGVLFGLFGGTLNSLSDLASGSYAHNYVAVKFTASETNTYVFGQTGAPVDTVMTLYNGTFDPTHPSTNALVLNDNTIASARPVGIVMDPGGCGGSTGDCPQVSANLTAGQTVTLVISTARANATLGLPQTIYASVPGYFSSINTPGNTPPSGNFTVGQPDVNGHVTIVSNVTDPNGDPVTYTVPDSEKGGTTTVNGDGTFTYTPSTDARHAAAADGATGNDLADSFTITAADGRGGFASTWLVVPVAPANVAPAGNPTAGTPNQSTGVVSGSVNATDADSDTVTYTPSTPGKGTVTVAADGTFTYTPTALARHAAAVDGAPASATTDSFTVTMYDGHGGTTVVPVSVAVGAANAVPTGNLSVGLPDATGRVTGNASVTDADFDPLSYTASTPANGTVTVAPNGAFTYTPTDAARHAAAAGGATSDAFTITVTDAHGGTLTIPVTVAIESSNAVPGGSVNVGSADAAGRVNGAVTISDGDSDVLSYTASAPGQGSVTVAADGTFIYTPSDAARHAAAADGAPASSDTFTITVNDGHGGTFTIPVSVSIDPANAAPIGSASVGSSDAAGRVSGTVGVSDADADPLQYRASAPGSGSVTLGPDGSFTYTPTDAARHAAAGAGPSADAFTITVTDGYGGTLDIPVSVAIEPANAVPTGTLSLNTAGSGGAVTGAVQATDADSDALSYTASAPANGSVTVDADGTFTYVPAAHKAASADAFTITVSDGHGGTFAVPVAVPAPAAAAPGETVVAGGGGQGGIGYSSSAASVSVAAADVTQTVTAAAVVDVAAVAAVEAAPPAAAAQAEPAAAAEAAPAAAADAASVSSAPAGEAGEAGSAANDASKDGSSDRGHGADAHGAASSRSGGQRAAMAAGRSAGKSAGRSAGKPFTPSAEEATNADPRSPSNPAAALGLVGVLLMTLPMAGASASAAAAGAKSAT